MDNEEIRKLLQELKESSDESSAVRSKVVKIHVDTPAEAERRQKVKEREREKELRRQAQEEARAQAEEEARRLEAERAAKEAVEEAKRQAKAGFAADLDEAILTGNSLLSDPDEAGENADDLDLNWNYEKPELKSGFVKEEDLELEGERRAARNRSAAEDENAPDKGSDDAGFDSDEADFREEEDRESITGLPGHFGALVDRGLSFFGGIRRSVKEDLSRTRGRKDQEEDEEEDDSDQDNSPSSGPADQDDPAGLSGPDPSDGEEDASGTDFDEEENQDPFRGPDPAGAAKPEATSRDYGPDEEWKRRMEEPPGKKSRFHRTMSGTGGLGRILQESREKRKKEKERKAASKEEERERQADSAVRNKAGADDEPDGAEALTEGAKASFEEAEDLPEEAKASFEEADALPEEADVLFEKEDVPPEDIHVEPEEKEAPLQETVTESERTDAGPDNREIGAGASDGENRASFKSIEIINLNENQNNKDAEVIPLIGNTGPLPDMSQLKKEEEKKGFFRGRTRKNPGREKPKRSRPDEGMKSGSAGGSVRSHKKQIIIAAVAAAAIIVLAAVIWFTAGQMKSGRHESIEADEGLTVRVLKQPENYTKEGDVQISVKAPETIQSITVNGENVVAQQGRSAEFTYHASGGTLDIMAVSTDKVRNAKVILAYVDSQPPVVTIREKDGRIALSAEDSESGLDAIYIGRTNGVSDIPVYEKYSDTLEMDPDKEITYYAVDHAQNATSPVTVALTPAESIAFERESYSLFPGSVEKVNLITTPAHAFVNNLTLEAENPKVAQVEGDMQIRGMKEGETKITATADGIAGVMASVSVASQRKVTISAIGDCTLGTDASFSQNNSFDAYEAMYGDSYFFEKVKGILGSDDSTFANFEGTLTNSENRRDKKFTFKGDPSYTQILLDGSVEVVSLANNHTFDFKEEGLADTKKALEEAGVEWCEGAHIAWKELNGARCAFIGIYALENGLESLPLVESTIAEAKRMGADLIVVGFHWGVELVTEIDEFERKLAHAAVDAGANLVVGTHSHVLMGIEKYNGAYICYGIGNFCFGGSSNPTSYDTIIWQQTFNFTADGLESEDDISIIPCQVSSDTSVNNYQPVPVSGDAAARIMQTIDSLSAEFGQSYSQYMVDGTMWTES